ncbi:hypothetical protein JHK87_008270 [Glycine soja]|nr:hypothetical protein JHK87_008270 [Glycine soja]
MGVHEGLWPRFGDLHCTLEGCLPKVSSSRRVYVIICGKWLQFHLVWWWIFDPGLRKETNAYLTKDGKGGSLSRVSLRPLKMSDVDDFLLWAGDDQVTRNLRWETCGDDRCRAEIDYAIVAKYWGQGISTKAVKIAVTSLQGCA